MTMPIENSSKKLRVLAIAEAANPEWTSVPLVGWNLANALSKIADVHLVTQIRNKQALIRKGLIEGADFTAIDNEKVLRPLLTMANRLFGRDKQSWTAVMAFGAVGYYSFEWQIWKQFRNRLMAGEFDIVHRITPLSPTMQSLLPAKLAKHKIPFILGPLNGGVPWPKSFRSRQYAEREYLSHIRQMYRLMPFYRSTRRNSSAIIAGSRFTLSELPRWSAQKSVFIPENGVDEVLFSEPRTSRDSIPLQAAFVGRLVPYKGADILIEAASAFLRAGQLKLHIIGDGPQKAYLLEKTRELGLDDSVTFHGWVPHSEIHNKLRVCDFLALPSIREFGGGVVVEAMALGITPMVADYGGPADLVDSKTGILVPFKDEGSLVEGFRTAIERVIREPDQLNILGQAARAKALQDFTWTAKAAQMLRIYKAVQAGNTCLRTLGLKLEGGPK